MSEFSCPVCGESRYWSPLFVVTGNERPYWSEAEGCYTCEEEKGTTDE